VSDFRSIVGLLFERLGFERPAPAYLDDVAKLNAACAAWQVDPAHLAMGALAFDVPDLLNGGVVMTGNLLAAIDHGWATNDAARAFIRYVDELTGRRCTLLQFQVVLVIQELVQQAKVNAGGGRA
jgi:hypothetical protein